MEKLTKAGFWIRVLARLIDVVFIFLISQVAGFICGIIFFYLSLYGVLAADWPEQIKGLNLISIGFGILGNIFYHFFCEGIHGATVGKLCCGIRVVRADGNPSNLKGALIRTVAYFIDSLFFGLVALTSMQKSPLNQRYGDVWGKTAVLKTTEIAPESQRNSVDFVMGLILGAGCLMVAVAVGLISRIVQ